VTPLSEDHATHAQEIAEQEVRRFARLFAAALARTPMRADGAMNAHDLYACLSDAIKCYDQGDVA
jgi:hypothetical protein